MSTPTSALWQSVLSAHAEVNGSVLDVMSAEMLAIAGWLDARGDAAAAAALRAEAAYAAPTSAAPAEENLGYMGRLA